MQQLPPQLQVVQIQGVPGIVNLQQVARVAQSSLVATQQQGQFHYNNRSFNITGANINQGSHAMDFGIVGNGQPWLGTQQTQPLQQLLQMQPQIFSGHSCGHVKPLSLAQQQMQLQIQQQMHPQIQQEMQQLQQILQQHYSGQQQDSALQQQLLLEELSWTQVKQHGQKDFVVRQNQAIPTEAKTTSTLATNASTSITTAIPVQRPLENVGLMQPPFEASSGGVQPTTQTTAQPVVQETAQPQQIPWPQQIQGSQHQYSGQQQNVGQQEQSLQQQQSDAQQLPGSQLPPWLL